MLRYRLLETVRLYAEERLVATGAAAEFRSVHRDWVLTWIESLPVGELVGFGAGALVVSEADNLTAALDWSLQQGREDLVARIASRMIGYWWSYVRVAEMGAWWRELQRNLAAMMAWCERRREDAAGQLRAAAALAREYAIPLGETSCLVGIAALAADDGDYQTASRHLATVRSAGAFPFRTPLDVLVYRRVSAAVAEALDNPIDNEAPRVSH